MNKLIVGLLFLFMLGSFYRGFTQLDSGSVALGIIQMVSGIAYLVLDYAKKKILD